MMRDAVIVAAVRSPVGKRNGALATVHPVDLSAHVLNALAERAGLADPAEVDDVIWGCVSQVGEQTFDIARNTVLTAGWPQSVPGVTVDRQCGSSQQSVHFAAAGLISGQYDLVVAGGVESMTRVPMGSSLGALGPDRSTWPNPSAKLRRTPRSVHAISAAVTSGSATHQAVPAPAHGRIGSRRNRANVTDRDTLGRPLALAPGMNPSVE